MNMAWKKFAVGTSHAVYVKLENIQDSDPCNKDNCMLSRAVIAHLLSLYGTKFKVKSTNHGLILELAGRRITFVFDTTTAKRIWEYDVTFKKTRSRTKAWSVIKPFKAKLMVEANIAVPDREPMSEETKKRLAQRRKKHPHPTREAQRRELSL